VIGFYNTIYGEWLSVFWIVGNVQLQFLQRVVNIKSVQVGANKYAILFFIRINTQYKICVFLVDSEVTYRQVLPHNFSDTAENGGEVKVAVIVCAHPRKSRSAAYWLI